LFKVATVSKNVQVDVPSLEMWHPLHLNEGDAAVTRFPPELFGSELREGAGEVGEELGEGFVRAVERERDEAGFIVGQLFENVKGDGLGSRVCTWQAEAVVAGATADAIVVGVLGVPQNVGAVTTLAEIPETIGGGADAFQRFVDTFSVPLPACVAKN